MRSEKREARVLVARRTAARGHALLLTALAILLVVTAGAGCGAASEADRRLDDALSDYRSALEQLRELDSGDVSKERLEAAREQLDGRWSEVERRAEEAGRELTPGLERAQARVDDALEEVREDVGSGAAQARRSVRAALDEASTALEDAWQTIRDLF